MPPIDPVVLRTRAQALGAQLAETRALAAGVRALLDDYADLTHRASPRVAGAAIENSFKTPPPVLRALVAALRGPAAANPAAALAAAEALWAAGSREERRLAAELLGQAAPRAPGEAMALAQRWLPHLESGETAEALAEQGLGGLIRADPATYLGLARQWAVYPLRLVRHFGLATVAALARDPLWDNVPAALYVVEQVMLDPDGDVRRTAAALLRQLAAKSPAEVTHFLLRQAARPSGHTHWIVRHALPALPAEAQAEVMKVLRG